MKDKTLKQLGKEVGDVLVIVWAQITSAVQWIWKQLSKISPAWIQKIVGAIVVGVTSIAIAVEVILALFLIGDPYQTEQVIKSLSGIQLFDYVTVSQYIVFVTGGVVLDIIVLTLVMWFGIWLYGRTNWFTKPKHAWLYAAVIGFVGLAMIFGSLFYAAPKLVELTKELHEKKHQKHIMKQDKNQRAQYDYYYPSQQQFLQNRKEIEDFRRQLEREFWR